MKNIYFISSIIFTLVFIFSCQKEEAPTGTNKMELGNTSSSEVSYRTATVSCTPGKITGNKITQHGHCWGIAAIPTINDDKSALGSLTEARSYTSQLEDLIPNTSYFIRSYLKTDYETVYGTETSIITLKTGKPVVTTSTVDSITINSAVCGGTTVIDSGLVVSEYGLVWDTLQTFSYEKNLEKKALGDSLGTFSYQLTDLIDGKTYYVKSYAKNSAGIGYGETENFATIQINLPKVTTAKITNITTNSAESGGEVTDDGNSEVTARGIVWSTEPEPTIEDNLGKTKDSTSTRFFTNQITNLQDGETYFVRAYATNDRGTGYGDAKNFSTIMIFANLYLSDTSVYINDKKPILTFKGNNGTAPYSFIYRINDGVENLINTLPEKDTVSVEVPTNVVGSFTYNLVKVIDALNGYKDTSITKTILIKELPGELEVDFDFTDNPCSDTPTNFTSTLTEGKSPFKYSWDFGDGKTSTAKNPTHTYTSLGCGTEKFTIVLTVTDAGTISKAVNKTITVKQQPDISFKDENEGFYEPFDNCDNASIDNPSYSITVINDSKSTCIDSYSIDWGDGNSTFYATFPANHTYANLGAFNMVIRAKGSNGCDNDVLFIVNNQTNPISGLISPGNTSNLCAPTDLLKFEISNWGLNSPGTIYEVDFGDDSGILRLTQEEMWASEYYNPADLINSYNFPIPHVYYTTHCPEEGYIVKLKVSNACAETPASVGGITVFSVPEADFTAPSSYANTNITFTNKTIAGYNSKCKQEANFTWDFGDGSAIVEIKNSLPQNASATHTYTTQGVYNVTLTAKNSTCGETFKTKQITITQ